MRVALILEGPGGETMAVVCNSVAAADKIREATPFESLGTVPIVNRMDVFP